MTDVLEMMNDQTKKCPICFQVLPLSEFGICRARKDGRNLYCKSCIRHKVSESRRSLKEYKSVRKRHAGTEVIEPAELSLTENQDRSKERSVSSPYNTRALGKLSPVERVRDAIRKGARTQKEIAQETKLGKDEIGDALANLLLWTREVRTQVMDNTRIYLINDSIVDNGILDESNPVMPRRKGDVPSSFSSLQGLMPGRNPEGEPEKIGGWVAA